MLTEPGGPFIDISKLNLSSYAQKPALAKVSQYEQLLIIRWNWLLWLLNKLYLVYYFRFFIFLKALFEYLFHHESSIRSVS